MIRPRWRKVLADLWGNKVRTILVILSIAVGVFAMGTISSLYISLSTDMDADYQSANPHSGMIYTSPFPEELLTVITRLPGVERAEGRSMFSGRIVIPGGEKYPIRILAIPPADKMQIDQIRAENPKTLPDLAEHEILFDRSTLDLFQVKPGENVSIDLLTGKTRQLKVAGIVHDVTSFSYMFTGEVTAFVNQDTMEWLGGSKDFNIVYFTVADQKKDEAHVNAVARLVADKIEKSGRSVYSTIVLKPGQHPIGSLFRTGVTLIGAFGIVLVFLTGFLVVNTVTALLSQHSQQIGIMKAIGGQTNQLVSMYITLVTCFGAIALALAIPSAASLSYSLSFFFARLFNFNLSGFHIPWITLLLQTVVALAVPIFAALSPVLSGARISIRDAISNNNLGNVFHGKSLLGRVMESIRGLPRPFVMTLRNTLRHKVRLVLTLLTLTTGGAVFIAVFNLQASLSVAINETMGYFLSDLNINFSRAQRVEAISRIVKVIPGVVGVEGWGISDAQVLSPDKKTSTEVVLWAPPATSKLIKPVMTAGRWLVPDDENAIVVGNHFLEKRPNVKVGDHLTLKIDGKESTWQVVGIYQLAGQVYPPYIYTNYEHLARLQDRVDQVSSFRVVTAPRDAATQDRIASQLEESFRQSGIHVSEMTTGARVNSQEVSQFNILVYVLLVVASLIALVGGLGLTGMLSLNVLERTREIGVMRAIGATGKAILRMVILEGVLIGGSSWAFGSLLSLPVSKLLDDAVGLAFMSLPLNFVLSYQGMLFWLGGVLLLSALASILPALNASRLTIREALSYE